MANIDSVKLPNGSEYNLQDVVTPRDFTNPNLLMNPWFTVNQRGENSYSALNAYTVDRWSHPYGTAITVSSSGLTASGSLGSPTTIRQIFEQDSSEFIGKTITASAIIDGNIYTATKEIQNGSENGVELISADGTWLTMDTRTVGKFIVNFAFCGSHTLRALKLEIGSTSTLHLDTAPDYTTELLKCQRYYFKFTGKLLGVGIGSTYIDAGVLLFPVEMRAIPTLTYTNASYRYGASSWSTPSSVANPIEKNAYTSRFTISGGTEGRVYQMNFEGAAFNAEL